jgi:hypothetical protein
MSRQRPRRLRRGAARLLCRRLGPPGRQQQQPPPALSLSAVLPDLSGNRGGALSTIAVAPARRDFSEEQKVGTPTLQSSLLPEATLNRLSYSRLELIVDLDDEPMRDFYAAGCVRGNWSVRELMRQIASLSFDRSVLPREGKAGRTRPGRWRFDMPPPGRPRPVFFEVRRDNRVNVADAVSRILGWRYLTGSCGMCPDAGNGRDPWSASRSVSQAAPDKRVTVLVPAGRRLLDGLADLLPRLEPPPLQRQRLEHLAPRLDRVEVGLVIGLEGKLPARMRREARQHVGGPVRLEVVDDRVEPLDAAGTHASACSKKSARWAALRLE